MRYALLCGTVVVLSLPFAPVAAQEPIVTPYLSSDENFRDLAGISAAFGGTGWADSTSHNGVMRTGVFYRSEDLHALSNADSETIFLALNVRKDIDLRTPEEYNLQPDINVPGPVLPVIHVNIFGTDTPPLVSKQDLYCDFVTNSVERANFHTLLIDLANSSGPVLYHCDFGKDRTGWTSVILQSIAGVSLATITQDYLASNAYLHDPFAVQESWLDAALNEVNKPISQGGLFGSMHAYLTEGLGLTQADIYVLRQDGLLSNLARAKQFFGQRRRRGGIPK